MLARISTLAAATAAGLVVLGAPAHATAPDCHGIAVSDPAGDHYIGVSATNALVKPTAAIDITGAYLTGGAGAEKLNIRVADLSASPNTEYTFRWNDNQQFGAWYQLEATFLTSSGAHGVGSYRFVHGNSSSSVTFSTTGRTFPGPNGVVQIDLRTDQTSWPTTLNNVQVRSGQYEFNTVLEAGTWRNDTATAASWTQPC